MSNAWLTTWKGRSCGLKNYYAMLEAKMYDYYADWEWRDTVGVIRRHTLSLITELMLLGESR